ncbi:hypothetical protein [Ornithinibacillus californiensis]|uniref:hypothetical protein n=1 Tax=Ornithinibacillus californiensis TaxID=161536 RepID=UPI00064D9761|nr:hypothetical protein [Ornithinibacillus californiensis]
MSERLKIYLSVMFLVPIVVALFLIMIGPLELFSIIYLLSFIGTHLVFSKIVDILDKDKMHKMSKLEGESSDG